ncbi:MAG: hypothetical protein HYX27_02605 [Acidobacteria bacterium]|nr:hypothetical protein [Acidobacteriota bacterium]
MTGYLRVKARLIFVLMLWVVSAFGESVLWNHEKGPVLFRAVLVSEAEFNDKFLEELARRERTLRPNGLVKLVILTSEKQRFDLDVAYHMPISSWLTRCVDATTAELKVAELILLEGDAILRIRDGRVTRRILLTSLDPLQYGTPEVGFDVSNIHVEPYASRVVVHAIAKGNPTIRDAAQFFRTLREKVPNSRVSVVIRKDPWFIEEVIVADCWWQAMRPIDTRSASRDPEIHCSNISTDYPVCSGSLPK